MGHSSTPEFRSFHALRIKGFGSVDVISEIAGLAPNDADLHLQALGDAGHAQFRDKRAMWQLTADGREAHGEALAADLEGLDVEATFGDVYPDFVRVNVAFKELCGAWQLRDGEPNDHSDADYDGGVIDRLVDMHVQAAPLVDAMGQRVSRFAPYRGRLDAALDALRDGDTSMFTGVMCNSYHDVWMELHEDLIVTQGIDRQAEGSF